MSEQQMTVREPHYEKVGMAAIGAGGGMPAVQSMAEAVSVAQLMAKSGIAIRKHLRDNPGACLGVLMQALRWEFDPYMVGNKSYAVNDQLAYEAQLLAAVVLTRSPIVEEPDYTYEGEPFKTRKCTVTFKMRSGKSLSYTTPETSKITPKNSPLWKSDEDQQLGYFAVRSWAGRHQPHVLLGCYTPEEAETMVIDVTPGTSGVMSRLQATDTMEAGFNADHVERETKPRRGRPPKTAQEPEQAPPEPEEAMHAAEEPESFPQNLTGAAQDTPAPGDQALTSDEEAIEEPPMSGSDTGQTAPTPASLSEQKAQAIEGAQAVGLIDVIAEGYPEPDEIYHVNGDEWEASETGERRQSYKNGEPFSMHGRTSNLSIYEDHAPEGQQAAEGMDPVFEAYIDGTETVENWPATKEALGALQKTDFWKSITPEQGNRIRRGTWETLVDRKVDWLPDHTKDVSAFRLWIEAQDTAHDVIQAWADLQTAEKFMAQSAEFRDRIGEAAEARLRALGA